MMKCSKYGKCVCHARVKLWPEMCFPAGGQSCFSNLKTVLQAVLFLIQVVDKVAKCLSCSCRLTTQTARIFPTRNLPLHKPWSAVSGRTQTGTQTLILTRNNWMFSGQSSELFSTTGTLTCTEHFLGTLIDSCTSDKRIP